MIESSCIVVITMNVNFNNFNVIFLQVHSCFHNVVDVLDLSSDDLRINSYTFDTATHTKREKYYEYIAGELAAAASCASVRRPRPSARSKRGALRGSNYTVLT